MDIDTCIVLLPVLDGCHEQEKELERVLARMLHASEDRSWQVQMKAFTSVHQDMRVSAIVDTLRGYMTTLAHNLMKLLLANPAHAFQVVCRACNISKSNPTINVYKS